jgi:hypothetical protein
MQSILFSRVHLETTILILEERNIFTTWCHGNSAGGYSLNVNTQERAFLRPFEAQDQQINCNSFMNNLSFDKLPLLRCYFK